jgi:hypothetical protein
MDPHRAEVEAKASLEENPRSSVQRASGAKIATVGRQRLRARRGLPLDPLAIVETNALWRRACDDLLGNPIRLSLKRIVGKTYLQCELHASIGRKS